MFFNRNKYQVQISTTCCRVQYGTFAYYFDFNGYIHQSREYLSTFKNLKIWREVLKVLTFLFLQYKNKGYCDNKKITRRLKREINPRLTTRRPSLACDPKLGIHALLWEKSKKNNNFHLLCNERHELKPYKDECIVHNTLRCLQWLYIRIFKIHL